MSEQEGFRSTVDLSDEHQQELRRLAQAEPDTFWCEPCFYHEERTKATSAVGMDNTPVCDWHASHSWQSARPSVDDLQDQIKELSRVYDEAIIPQWRKRVAEAEAEIDTLNLRLLQAEEAVRNVIDEQGTEELHNFIDSLEEALGTVVNQLHEVAVQHAHPALADSAPIFVAYQAARDALYRTPPPQAAVSGKVGRIHPSMGNAPVEPEDYIPDPVVAEVEARMGTVQRALKEPYEVRGDGGIDRATVATAQEALAAAQETISRLRRPEADPEDYIDSERDLIMQELVKREREIMMEANESMAQRPAAAPRIIIDGVTYECCRTCAEGQHDFCNRLTSCECPELPFHRGHPSVKERKGQGATRGYHVEYPSRPDKSDDEPIAKDEWDDASVFANWPDVPEQTASGHNRLWEWGRRVTEYLGLRDE